MKLTWESIGAEYRLNEEVLVDGERQTITGVHIDMQDIIFGYRTNKHEFVTLGRISHGQN